MTDWFRSWHGAPTDPKWRTVARRAGVRPGDVAAVVWVLLDRASQAMPRGSIAGYDAEVIADALGFEPAEVEAVIAGLRGKDVLDGDVFVSWEKHQPSREDNSAERAKAWRERNRTQANAPERTQPQTSAREEESREDTEKKEQAAQHLDPTKGCAAPPDHSDLVLTLRHAAGLDDASAPALDDPSPILDLIAKGYSLTDRILPTLRRKRGVGAASWGYFVPAILEAERKAGGLAAATTLQPAEAIFIVEGTPAWAALVKARGKEPVKTYSAGKPGIFVRPNELQEHAA